MRSNHERNMCITLMLDGPERWVTQWMKLVSQAFLILSCASTCEGSSRTVQYFTHVAEPISPIDPTAGVVSPTCSASGQLPYSALHAQYGVGRRLIRPLRAQHALRCPSSQSGHAACPPFHVTTRGLSQPNLCPPMCTLLLS